MKLSRTVAYAVHAIVQLAELDSKTPVPCSQLATRGQMPERFLLQILRNLVTHGILQSMRGVEGGYVLYRPASEISLLEVIEAIDGPLAANLPTGEGLQGETQARLRQVLEHVAELSRNELQAIKLADLIPPSPVRLAPQAVG